MYIPFSNRTKIRSVRLNFLPYSLEIRATEEQPIYIYIHTNIYTSKGNVPKHIRATFPSIKGNVPKQIRATFPSIIKLYQGNVPKH